MSGTGTSRMEGPHANDTGSNPVPSSSNAALVQLYPVSHKERRSCCFVVDWKRIEIGSLAPPPHPPPPLDCAMMSLANFRKFSLVLCLVYITLYYIYIHIYIYIYIYIYIHIYFTAGTVATVYFWFFFFNRTNTLASAQSRLLYGDTDHFWDSVQYIRTLSLF